MTNPNVSLADDPAYKDRLTEESLLGDWEFTLAIAVEIDPEPYQKAPPPGPDESVSSAQE